MIVDVIIPAWNEEKSIGHVVKDIDRSVVRDVIVVDNNSKDNTSKVAREAGATAIPQPKQGYGSACLKGIEFANAKEPKADVIVFMDADYSDYANEMNLLLEPIAKGDADMVIGSRALGEKEKGSMTPQQVFGNWLATWMIQVIYKHKYSDLGPYRSIRFDSLNKLGMKDPDYGWTVEMQVKALHKKLKVAEVPVNYRKRIGVSKVSGTVKGTILAGYKIITTIIKYAWSSH
ncbi:MAG: glycosyltransferase family 2 protein [Flavobacteriales bacterium]|nr:glycosyltransferase family 2 protein [Flavobacteriales bacterium]MDG1780531.1 glycosyltransferase family 2 protein [Flavobacteriales bacterium]MDG2245469.1 glycosyltransferase family 2 protein [Flavobacteriales bacterium]